MSSHPLSRTEDTAQDVSLGFSANSSATYIVKWMGLVNQMLHLLHFGSRAASSTRRRRRSNRAMICVIGSPDRVPSTRAAECDFNGKRWTDCALARSPSSPIKAPIDATAETFMASCSPTKSRIGSSCRFCRRALTEAQCSTLAKSDCGAQFCRQCADRCVRAVGTVI